MFRLSGHCLLWMLSLSVYGQTHNSSEKDSIFKTQNLSNVTITSRRAGTKRMSGPVNGVSIAKEELFKTACCNLGESFTTIQGRQLHLPKKDDSKAEKKDKKEKK